jgi:hypothetical protein
MTEIAGLLLDYLNLVVYVILFSNVVIYFNEL